MANPEVRLSVSYLDRFVDLIGERYDLAIRVLRSIALMEAAPITRAVSYLRQGFIADKRGDRQKAVLWGRNELIEDPNCQDATDFLQRIGEL